MNERFVLDASLAVNWCFEHECNNAAIAILDGFAQGSSALVPSLWLWEINNALLMAQRCGNLNNLKRQQQIAFLRKLPINIDEDAHQQAWGETTNLAVRHDLTVYDAAYLELAVRQGLPLGSLDRNLRKAAKKIGITCLPEKF